MRKLLPVILIWRDKTIDMKGQSELRVPYGLYVGRGRHLKLINTPQIFILKVGGSVTLKGIVSIVPADMTEADLKPVSPEKIYIEANNFTGTAKEYDDTHKVAKTL